MLTLFFSLSGFGCYMDENIENCEDYGIYIVDRRLKSVEESIQQLCEQMFRFCQKTRRQRINQRNRTERLSDLLDWKRMGLEYIKARQLALHRVYPDSFVDDDDFVEDTSAPTKIPKPLSAPASPRIRYLANGYIGDAEEEEEDDGFVLPQKKEFPALRKQSEHASREEELLSEGDIQTLNKLTLEEKQQKHH
jgi:glycogen(starch) synthase